MNQSSTNICPVDVFAMSLAMLDVFESYADNKSPDQTAHSRSLIRAFAVRLQNERIE